MSRRIRREQELIVNLAQDGIFLLTSRRQASAGHGAARWEDQFLLNNLLRVHELASIRDSVRLGDWL